MCFVSFSLVNISLYWMCALRIEWTWHACPVYDNMDNILLKHMNISTIPIPIYWIPLKFSSLFPDSQWAVASYIDPWSYYRQTLSFNVLMRAVSAWIVTVWYTRNRWIFKGADFRHRRILRPGIEMMFRRHAVCKNPIKYLTAVRFYYLPNIGPHH